MDVEYGVGGVDVDSAYFSTDDLGWCISEECTSHEDPDAAELEACESFGGVSEVEKCS